eukprot:5006669-Pyramimonas_sp.AAC.2
MRAPLLRVVVAHPDIVPRRRRPEQRVMIDPRALPDRAVRVVLLLRALPVEANVLRGLYLGGGDLRRRHVGFAPRDLCFTVSDGAGAARLEVLVQPLHGANEL